MTTGVATQQVETASQETEPSVAVLVDFDNVVKGQVPRPETMTGLLSRFVDLALGVWPGSSAIQIRLYGGWQSDGLFTRRASEVQASLGSGRFFPLPHPAGSGLLRGDVSLVQRIAAVPEVAWSNTLTERSGLPAIRFRDGTYPLACVHLSSQCPLKAMRKIGRRQSAVCTEAGCTVMNKDAFRVAEQKMVDVMLACDVLEHVAQGQRVLVLSSDVDVVPAVAMAAKNPGAEVALLRVARYGTEIYDTHLRDLGVHVDVWEGA